MGWTSSGDTSDRLGSRDGDRGARRPRPGLVRDRDPQPARRGEHAGHGGRRAAAARRPEGSVPVSWAVALSDGRPTHRSSRRRPCRRARRGHRRAVRDAPPRRSRGRRRQGRIPRHRRWHTTVGATRDGRRPESSASALFEYLNWNKRRIELDFETEGIGGLAPPPRRRADIVVESLPPGRLAGVGSVTASCEQSNPHLVVTSISSFGREGPYAAWAATDLVLQAMSGIMQFSGTSDREPLKQGLRQSFYCAGLTAAYVSLVALYASLVAGRGRLRRRLDSRVRLVRARSQRGAFRILRRRPGSATDPSAIRSAGRSAAAIRSLPPTASSRFRSARRSRSSIWPKLLGEPGLAEPRFATTEARLQHIEELNEILARRLADESRQEFFVRASNAGCLTGVVQGARELLECPQLRSRQRLPFLSRAAGGGLAARVSGYARRALTDADERSARGPRGSASTRPSCSPSSRKTIGPPRPGRIALTCSAMERGVAPSPGYVFSISPTSSRDRTSAACSATSAPR